MLGGLRQSLVRIRDVPLDNARLITLAQQLGRACTRGLTRHSDLWEEPGLQRVTPIDGMLRDAYGKPLRSANSDFFAPHTDLSFLAEPCRYVMLHCWQPATTGGETLLVDGSHAMETACRVLQIALAQYRFAYAAGESVTVGTFWRFSAEDVRIGSPSDTFWLNCIGEHLMSQAFRIRLSSGELLVIDNHRWLHGRAAFSGSRLLKRLRID